MSGRTLTDRLAFWAAEDPRRKAAARLTAQAAAGCAAISALVRRGPLAGAMGAAAGGANADGDAQKALDVASNEIIRKAAMAGGAAYYASEEEEALIPCDPEGTMVLAADPLDGSSNIDNNISIGTIFAVFERAPGAPERSFLRHGHEQAAAGYVIYGPHTALALTMGEGTDLYVLDPASGDFLLAAAGLRIPAEAPEFAVNASNHRHWDDAIRGYVNDCLQGEDGLRGKNFNMRWVASLVAETHRILMRGGVFLYPADRRKGYAHGRLRLLYEAFPIAFLIEQAGGAATDGRRRILDQAPASLHARTPLVFGSSGKVARVAAYYAHPPQVDQEAPLFGSRGLFRA